MSNDLSIRIMAKNSIDKGVKSAKASFKKFSTSVKTAAGKMKAAFRGINSMVGGLFAGVSIAALVSLTKETIAFGSAITDLAKQSGLSTDQFQALEIAALNAGVSQEKIRTAMAKLNVVMGQAKSGMKTYVDLFDKVGISQEQLNALEPAEVFELLAKTMSEAQRGSVEFGAALEILGTRSGAQLIEVMEEINLHRS